MHTTVANQNKVSQQAHIINLEFSKLNKSLNNIVARYSKYTDKLFANEYNRTKSDQKEINTSLFDPHSEILADLIRDIHVHISEANYHNLSHYVKVSINLIERLFHRMDLEFREHSSPSRNIKLKHQNDAKFFRLIQRRINGARSRLLKLGANYA